MTRHHVTVDATNPRDQKITIDGQDISRAVHSPERARLLLRRTDDRGSLRIVRSIPPCEDHSDQDELGEWMAAVYPSRCDGCQGDIKPEDLVRSDGMGGFLGECCGGAA